jgi:peptidyl-dipeptidase A
MNAPRLLPLLVLTTFTLLAAPASAKRGNPEPPQPALESLADVRAAQLLGEHVRLDRPAYLAWGDAFWEAMTEGTPEAFERMEQLDLARREVRGDRDRFERARALLADPALHDRDLRRQLDMMERMALPYQIPEETRRRITEIEARCEELFSNYRMEVHGEQRSMADVERLMRTSTDGELLEELWKASKLVGVELEPLHRELVTLRNEAARELGFDAWIDLALHAQGFDASWLEAFFTEVEQATDAPFAALKADEIDPAMATRFGVEPGGLGPWHYGNPYFQDVPPGLYELDLDSLYARRDHEQVVQDAAEFFRSIGLPADGILERSDLYPREGKNPHAMAHKADLERRDTAVLLMNLPRPPATQNRMGTSTLVHELGHCVHYEAVDHGLPYLFLDVDSQITEAFAMMMERQVLTEGWLTRYLGLAPEPAREAVAQGEQALRAQELIFARWCLVIYHWERDIYTDPDQDWGEAWWRHKLRYQGLARPEGWSNPDALGKYHLATAMTTYYNNYAVGGFVAAQIADALATHIGQDVSRADYRDDPAVGLWLTDRVLGPGARFDWLQVVENATGGPLSTDAWRRQILGAAD